jgi:hypothetical protein
VVNAAPDQVLNLAAVRLFKRRKAAYIKWLKEMRRMWRHTERNNIAFFAEILE